MQPVSILIADDDPLVRRCLRHAVGCDRHLVVQWEADNGLQALALAQQHHPQLILIDSHMDRMNGFEATRCLRHQDREVRILVLGVYETDRAQALEAGADAFVVKDSGCEAIRKAIHNLLHSTHSETANSATES